MKKIIFAACVLGWLCLLETPLFAEELKTISLPAPQTTGGQPLMEALKNRKSAREFSSEELPLQILSNLLWAANGINRPDGRRTAPSAHNAQEIEIYVAKRDGLYQYDARQNALTTVFAKDIRAITGKQDFVKEAPVVLIFVADLKKLGNESDRFYDVVDTGFVSQNVYLYCASTGLATVVLGWINREAIAEAMKLNKDQQVILTQPVGYPKK